MTDASIAGTFSPIAIVGRGCVLPSALDPAELWQAVKEGRDLVTSVPVERWGIRPSRILSDPPAPAPDRSWSDRGGYVRGFERIFDPGGFHLAEEEILGLDPLFHWVLHTGRAALRESKWRGDRARAGVILGNLSYPSTGLSKYAEGVWLDRFAPVLGENAADRLGIGATDARNRFMSGLPAHLLARSLDLGGRAFALDAACASSLYAIKLACDALHDREADLMLAGAVNRADDLFLHVGFTALQALSRTGKSRPFHADADGLLPAEGACMFALRRLEDAESEGETIYGVIRSVGLSNDGRDRGLLVPSRAGQVKAMRRAFELSGLAASDIDFVECHATGTAVGDATEIASLNEVYGERPLGIPIGSFKANCGHLITAAGGAGLLKVLAAMEHGEMPLTPHVDKPHPDLGPTSLRVLSKNEMWLAKRPRRASVSAFGFGGNNAHLLVEQYQGRRRAPTTPAAPRATVAVAIIAMGARVADGNSAADFESAIFSGESRVRRRDGGSSASAEKVDLALTGLRFPPADLRDALPQQLLLLESAREAVEGLSLEASRTGVFVGMQCDPEIARHGARWRLIEWAQKLGGDREWLEQARQGVMPLLGAAGVIGAMPNVVANRLNSQFGYSGPSFAVSSEELSGVRALDLASRALRSGELDAALVGAVDMSAEEVHLCAAAGVLSTERQIGGDAAVVLVLKRLSDAEKDGDRVLAVLEDCGSGSAAREDSLCLSGISLVKQFGHAHAASGLLHVAAGVLCCARAEVPPLFSPDFGERPLRTPFCLRVEIQALGEQSRTVQIRAHGEKMEPALVSSKSPAEPVLSLPAHRAPPYMRSPKSSHLMGAQVMEAAPQLALVMPVLSQKFSRPGPEVAFPMSAVVARHLELQRAISVSHQHYLREQASSHSQFIEMRGRIATAWLGTRAAATRATAPPSTTAEVRAKRPHPPATAHREPLLPGMAVRGPSFSRAELEIHSSGRISEIFGAEFSDQDDCTIQVRMPEAPLLLADRIVGLDAVPHSMELGTVWSETDVHKDSWFVHRGRVPAGILIECGQADLFLISYLGIDRLNKGHRAYRLLGCELTYHGEAPRVGDTLHYEIHIDSHAAQGDVRLFFFHSDCHVGERPIMSVRNGQAGFFTEQELADSAGVLWIPENEILSSDARVDAPRVLSRASEFDEAKVKAFAQGDLFGCFGAGFERAQSHTDSPAIQDGDLNFIDRIEALDPLGGPWGRGYARAVTDIHPNNWFFKGHFKNDPCMPGTLMFEGCLQLMAFYLAALGHTLERDGWRFEPVSEVAYQLHCRGQVVPSSKQLVCEIFVEEIWNGPEPTVFAHLLGTVDGKKAFHARHVGLRLVPDWPLTSRAELRDIPRDLKTVASAQGFDFGYASLLACAWGKPSEAFGPMYRPFDGTRRVARLPGPPYHFMTRVTRIDGEIGVFAAGAEVEIEYDVPSDAWYFDKNGAPLMPFSVLLEVALQPCGWLASYVGSALTCERDLAFRNLDGKGRVLGEVGPGVGTIRTISRLTDVSKSGDMIIQSFDVQSYVGNNCVYELTTVFGFFPEEALANQVGLPTSDAKRTELLCESSFHEALTRPNSRYFGSGARLPQAMLCMLDRVTCFKPQGGAAGLGFLRGEKDVDPSEWFFRAHFFQDPVQPGSLGIEVMLQLLQFYMLETEMVVGSSNKYFQAIELGQEMVWKYRGQVVPENGLISTTLEITERGADERGPFARGNASLWVDGKRIYEAWGLGMRLSDEGGFGIKD